ncbi:MAG: PEP-CTERM system TPR-repeat protein PrsT, partial [Rhodospirillales bacterium]|nr:PEP-CTERM system TPR-repeat protein PrsT [Rhodospirillales bacterium]
MTKMTRFHLMGTTLLAAVAAIGIGLASPPAMAASYLARARAALAKGDLDTAQIELRNAVRENPRSGEVRFLLAQLELEKGNAAAAETQAKAARERGYDDRQVIPILAQSILSQNHPQELLDTIKPLGKDKIVDSEIEVARATAYIALNDAAHGAAALTKAETLDPANAIAWFTDSRLALAQGKLPAAKEKLARGLASAPKSVRGRTLQAQIMAIDKNVPGALTLLGEVIKERPPALPARLLRANLLIATGKFAAAREDVTTTLKILPGNAEAMFLSAVLAHQEGKNEIADQILDRLQPMFVNLTKGWFLQAAVKDSLGQEEAAAAAARRYVGQAPDDVNGAKLLAQIEFKLHRPELAIAPLARLVADHRSDAQAYDMLGRAYAALGDPAQASKMFQQAATLAPKDVGVRTQLASTLLASGDPNQAVSQLDQALALAPHQPQVGEALFLAALKTGDLDKAAAALAKVKAAQGETASVLNLEGLLALARLHLPEAKTIFAAAIKKDPSFTPARINLARTLAMQGDDAGYRSALQAILDKAPASEPALTLLGNALFASGDHAGAETLLLNAHKAEPKSIPLVLRLGDLYIRDKAPAKALDLVREMSPSALPGPALLGLQAAAQLALGDEKPAETTLTALLTAEPHALVARRELAALKLKSGDYAPARDLIQAGIGLAPTDYQLYLDYALIDFKEHGLDAAITTARRLRDQDQGFALLQALPGDVCMAAGQPARAEKEFRDAYSLGPSLLMAVRIASALQGEKKPDAALAEIKAWLTAHPDDLAAMHLISDQLIARKDYAGAKTYLAQILAKQPHDGATLNNLAWIDQQLGDMADARDHRVARVFDGDVVTGFPARRARVDRPLAEARIGGGKPGNGGEHAR